MGQAIPSQHPAVALRSHYRQLRTLLTISLVVLVGLSVALVIVATDDEVTTTTATPVQSLEDSRFNALAGRNGGTFAAPDARANVVIPDESTIAAAVSGAQQASDQSGPGGPDESSVAASIARGTASPTGDPSVSQLHPGARP